MPHSGSTPFSTRRTAASRWSCTPDRPDDTRGCDMSSRNIGAVRGDRLSPPRQRGVSVGRAPRAARGSRLLRMLRTTDPKDIGILYLVTSFGFFLAGGAMALL